ncbi:MAG: serine/threonine-protein kinase [Polyangiaceae bacterium]
MGPGDVLRGKYELVESIGRGGMGEVFRAVHLDTGNDVAIKVVSRTLLDDTLIARLEREALAAGRIASEFVPPVYEIDRTDEGELFLVMELLFGQSLSERLRGVDGFMTWEEARLIGDNVLRGLIDAHAAGVVHRDLKPGNIFLESLDNGGMRAKILDFGVCKLDVVDGEKLTMTGESVGTIAYMAPEQIRGASKVNERADLYSFAMVIFEILCGRLAYEEKGQIALLAEKLEKNAMPLRNGARVPIPAGLDTLIDGCLARDPRKRPASAAAVLEQWRLLGAATLTPSPAATTGSFPANPPTQTGLTAPTILTTSMPAASRASIALAVMAVIASSVIIATVVHRRNEETAAAVAPVETVMQAETMPTVVTAAPPETPPAETPSAEVVIEDIDQAPTAAPNRPTTAPTRRPHHATPHPRHSSEPTIMDKPRF